MDMFGVVLFCVVFCFLCIFIQPYESADEQPTRYESETDDSTTVPVEELPVNQPCESTAEVEFDIDKIISIIDPYNLLYSRNATVSDEQPTRYESETDDSTTVPVEELPVKSTDLHRMSAAEIRALCREKGIKCNSRGRISARVYEELAALL
jgi:hypothetical protein